MSLPSERDWQMTYDHYFQPRQTPKKILRSGTLYEDLPPLVDADTHTGIPPLLRHIAALRKQRKFAEIERLLEQFHVWYAGGQLGFPECLQFGMEQDSDVEILSPPDRADPPAVDVDDEEDDDEAVVAPAPSVRVPVKTENIDAGALVGEGGSSSGTGTNSSPDDGEHETIGSTADDDNHDEGVEATVDASDIAASTASHNNFPDEAQIAPASTNAQDRRDDDDQPKDSGQDDVQPSTERRGEGDNDQGEDGKKDVKLVLSPAQCLLFSFPKDDAAVRPRTTLTLSHPDAEAVDSIEFEIEWTKQENYQVEPTQGAIQPGEHVQVNIVVKPECNQKVRGTFDLLDQTVIDRIADSFQVKSKSEHSGIVHTNTLGVQFHLVAAARKPAPVLNNTIRSAAPSLAAGSIQNALTLHGAANQPVAANAAAAAAAAMNHGNVVQLQQQLAGIDTAKIAIGLQALQALSNVLSLQVPSPAANTAESTGRMNNGKRKRVEDDDKNDDDDE